MTKKQYLISKPDMELFLKSKEFAALKAAGFAKWGSKEQWKADLVRKGSGPRNEFDRIVQNLKTLKKDIAFNPNSSANFAGNNQGGQTAQKAQKSKKSKPSGSNNGSAKAPNNVNSNSKARRADTSGLWTKEQRDEIF